MRCDECKHFRANTVEMDKGECRYNPPRAFLVGSPGGLHGQSVMQIHAYWPPVLRDAWCSKFDVKIAVN